MSLYLDCPICKQPLLTSEEIIENKCDFCGILVNGTNMNSSFYTAVLSTIENRIVKRVTDHIDQKFEEVGEKIKIKW